MEPLTKENVRKMFGNINPRYDFLNHVLSAGQDIIWRKFTAKRLPEKSENILDIATGTGDMALEIVKKQPQSKIYGLDFEEGMLNIANEKALRKNASKRISLILGDALHLPFPNGYFDALTIAFGFRNLKKRFEGLKEMQRVVRKGGKVLILEMTLPKRGIKGSFFKWYLKNVIPSVGGLVSGNKQAYEYLKNSIEGFLKPDELTKYFNDAGFSEIKAFPLTFGITYLHEGIVS